MYTTANQQPELRVHRKLADFVQDSVYIATANYERVPEHSYIYGYDSLYG